MMTILITLILLMVLAGISKSIMDTVDFRFNDSIFSKFKSEKVKMWFNQSQGWKNKYKDRDPDKGPAFPGSTTALSWITDSWHFFQMIMLTSLQVAIAIPVHEVVCEVCHVPTWLFYLGFISACKFVLGGTFELFWDKIWKKK